MLIFFLLLSERRRVSGLYVKECMKEIFKVAQTWPLKGWIFIRINSQSIVLLQNQTPYQDTFRLLRVRVAQDDLADNLKRCACS